MDDLDEFGELGKENAEIEEYLNAHLRPKLEEYVRNCRAHLNNHKCWTPCDMWFTAFLINEHAKFLWSPLENGHALYMVALRRWNECLKRMEAQNDFHKRFKQQHGIPPRVYDADYILEDLVEARRARLQEGSMGHLWFDTLVVETSVLIKKEHKLYCLWLTYIVQCGCKELYQHLLDFHGNVTCHWFDSVNTDRAGVLVDRANDWVLGNTDFEQLLKYANVESFAQAEQAEKHQAQVHASGTQTCITPITTAIRNQYLVGWR